VLDATLTVAALTGVVVGVDQGVPAFDVQGRRHLWQQVSVIIDAMARLTSLIAQRVGVNRVIEFDGWPLHGSQLLRELHDNRRRWDHPPSGIR
jgi:hypothetical protein